MNWSCRRRAMGISAWLMSAKTLPNRCWICPEHSRPVCVRRARAMEMATYCMTSFLCEYSRALLERAIEGGIRCWGVDANLFLLQCNQRSSLGYSEIQIDAGERVQLIPDIYLEIIAWVCIQRAEFQIGIGKAAAALRDCIGDGNVVSVAWRAGQLKVLLREGTSMSDMKKKIIIVLIIIALILLAIAVISILAQTPALIWAIDMGWISEVLKCFG